MSRISWALPVALSVLTALGCSSPDKPGDQPDAPAGPADAGQQSADAGQQPADAGTDGGTTSTVDPNLPPEPVIPAVCVGATLDAAHVIQANGLPAYDLAALDTGAIQAAITSCAAEAMSSGQKRSVHLQVNASDATKVAFVSGPLTLVGGVTLWIDRGVTLFAAQNPRLYDVTPGSPTCGTDANNNSGGCLSLINVKGNSATDLAVDAGVMGDGTIDGLGGEPMVGGFNGNPNATWWDVAQHAKPTGASHSNPRLIDVLLAKRFVLSHVTLQNSPKFHVGLESDDYIVWGVTVQTPSRATNSVGRKLTPAYARNTDGIDPSDSWNGIIAYSHISVGDDQIAFKCGKYHLNSSANAGQPSCTNLIVAHNQFGTGHGMSIGSETNGGPKVGTDARIGVQGVVDAYGTVTTWGLHVYDLTIDGDVSTGGADDVDINGIRIKSDVSRGGLVKDVLYENVCLRNLPNPIILNPHYDPTKIGDLDPMFQNIVLRNIHSVASSGGTAPPVAPIVTLLGLNQGDRTTATLDNVIVDGIATTTGIAGQFADLTLGPGPVNFTPRDTLSGSGVDSTVTVTQLPQQSAAPVACGDRFTYQFPDFGADPSKDNNASLSNLVLTVDGAPAALSPVFSPKVTSYSAALPRLTGTVAVTPTVSAAHISAIRVAQDSGTPFSVASGSAATLVLPAEGATSHVVITVIAEDGATTASYTLVLARGAAGTDATLVSLTDSAGALQFDPGERMFAYTVPVALATGYSLTPTARDPSATIMVNDAQVASGTPAPIDLSAAITTVLIRVTSEDGATTNTYMLEITVDHTLVPVTGLALSASTVRLDTTVSQTTTLVATLSPPSATDRAVTWTSSNPAVATVDASGTVTALSAGQTVITATSHDGGFSQSCTVHVFSLMFSDDFEAGFTKWDDLTQPPAAPNGAFSLVTDDTQVLKYTAATLGGVLTTVKDAAWTGVISGPTSDDYYVEARIKPLSNSTTSNKRLYLLARYQDPTHWYAAGLNVQSSTSSTAVDIAKTSGSAFSRPSQTKRVINIGQWYTVRFELVGPSLTVYLDGEKLGTATDAEFPRGKIGLFTDNKSFEIDDVRVGNPIDRPIQLTVSSTADFVTEAGNAPAVVTVTAQKPDYDAGGFLPDTFSVASSNPGVVSVAVNGSAVSLTPAAAGTATVTFTSGSDPSLTRTINAVISPAFVQSTTVYDLSGVTAPVAGDGATYIDGRLTLTFDAPPTLGSAGSVRIFRQSDDALVDVIKPTAETDAIGFPGQSQVRIVNVEGLITINGNTATIVPHHAKLAYGTQYYVAIASNVFTGAAIHGTSFDGLGKVANWSFTTRASPSTDLTTIIVDDDGAADFRSVQGALDHAMKNLAADTPVTVQVKNGTYTELLFLRGKNNVNIVGESRDGVVIQYRNYESLNTGSGASQAIGSGSPGGGRAVFLIETSDLLTLDTLTLRNTMLRSTTASSQAETIFFGNDTGRLIAKNATFSSEQDTLQLKGYAWFFNCLVSGNVDFIWGNNRVSLFENSEIRSVGDTSGANAGGYVVQARSVTAADKGFVFLNSQLTHGPGPGPGGPDVSTGATAATYLARSPGGTASFDNVAYIKCKMDNHIVPVGWADGGASGQPVPNPQAASAASGWREYGSMDLTGARLDVSQRMNGYTLTDAEFTAGFSTRAQIFAAFGGGAGWNPTP